MNKIDSVEGVSLNIVVREDKVDNKKVFVINNEDLGVSDFGDTLDEAMVNFRKSAKMYLEAYPEKKQKLVKEESPLLVSRIFL